MVEEAAKPVLSSAHFPRITKHDLEVVVEAMDKLREALRVEEAAKPWQCFTEHPIRKTMNAAAPPSVDGLEAQCALIEELRYQIREAWPAPWSVEMFPLSEKAVAGFAAFIRTRDRELVEKLEGLELDTDRDRELVRRAVLAARNEGEK